MECVTGYLCNLLSRGADNILLEITRGISYVFCHERRVENFERKVKSLKERRDRVKHAVVTAERNSEKIENDVHNWLIKVDEIINEKAKEVKKLEDEAKDNGFIGLCPNFKSRYQLSEKAEEEAKAVDELLQQGVFDKVSYLEPPQAIVDASPKEFEAFDSRKQVFNDVLEAVKDPSINIIGVYGMAGVGKTTFVKEIARQVREDKLFKSVVMVAVTRNPDIKEIQVQIADMLGLNFKEQSVTGRASRLCERLKKEKILVILDNIWARLDLTEVGIPTGDEHKAVGIPTGDKHKEVGISTGDEHKGCTVLLTSRDLSVLKNCMDAQKYFQIGVLKEEEAWDLFKKMAGDNVERPALRSIATQVAIECASLPIAISTIARALRTEDLVAWRDALRKLKNPSPSNFSGAPAAAYSAIELSYNHLESEELKQTFLLCSLLGHDASIQYLLECAMGLGLFHGVTTVEEARDRLLTVVSNLKASCLLLDSYTNDCIDMHDLVCDVAISIASRGNHVFALKHEEVMKAWPNAKTMKSWDKIVLHYASISKLPDQLKCPKLTLFIMESEDPSMEVPTNFFNGTKNLKVLDMTKMHFSSLPSSISLLSNLRTLGLYHCLLGDVAIIGELKNLEILSLFGSDIEMLPMEIGRLIELKLFDLTDCTKLKIIPPGLLSSLSTLEELYMGNSFVDWEAEGYSQPSNASLAELKALSCLSTLDVHIPNANIIPKDLFFEGLPRYKIFIGEAWDWDDKIEYSRTLKLRLNTSIGFLNYGVKMLLKQAENLHLDEMTGVEILLHELEDQECFRQLKNLHIQNGASIRYVVNNVADKIEVPQLQSLTLQDLPNLVSFCSKNKGSTSITPQDPQDLTLFNEKIVFPKLENLKLSSINIERIWHYQLPRGSANYSIHSLTSLIIEGCGNLKHILSYSMAKCLQQLESFEIIDCKGIQEIIATEEINNDGKRATISFPHLNSLKIKGLQKLIRFCHEDYSLEFPSLKILKIKQCPELKGFINKSLSKNITTCTTNEALFNEQVAFPNLEKMIISHLRNVKRIWYNQLSVDSFSKLKALKAEYCDELLNIFSSFALGVFQRLEILTVTDCFSLEEVFELQVPGLDIKDTSCVVDIQLRELYLYRLPKLKHVWKKDPHGNISFQNLRQVVVEDCWSLKGLFPFSIAKGLAQLESLEVTSCGVEEIVSKNEGLDQEILLEFPQLSSLTVWNLPNLNCFYPGKHNTMWPVLKKLKTYACGKFKIFGQLKSQIQQPLFLIEKVIPRLEKVSLSIDDIVMISDGLFASNSCFYLKVLWITGYENESTVLPFRFLQRFCNLKILHVFDCDFKELSSYEGDVGKEKDLWTLPKIKRLQLDLLPKIGHLWKQDSPLDHICASLETLEVWRCESLINLGSSSASFQTLTTLDVWNCKGMRELITSSKAQSLVRLVTMRIKECEMMKEVVGGEGDGDSTDEIIFRELKCLELHCLPSLRNFCSGNHTFKFPSLEQVILSQCPGLKSFCHGALSTLKLQRVQVDEMDYKGRWAGDLNATIKQLHKEKVGFRGLKLLKLSMFPELMDIWNRNPQEFVEFKNLTQLIIEGCGNLKHVLSYSMAQCLQQLESFEIIECSGMEEVIAMEEIKDDGKRATISFPRLKSLKIEGLQKLVGFCHEDYSLEFPSLMILHIEHCPELKGFINKSMRKDITTGTNNEAFFNEQVIFPNLERMVISHLRNVKRIWYNQLHVDSFCNLKELKAEYCDGLLNIFPSFILGVFQGLEILTITDCDSLKEVFELQIPGLDIKDACVLAIQLRELYLYRLPKLKHIWNKDPHGNISFQNLRQVVVGDCSRLKSLFPFSIAKGLVQLESLEVTSCGVEEIVSKNEVLDQEIWLEFPQLSSLELWVLPNLKYFYPGKHNTTWPVLKKLKAYGCGKLKIFGQIKSQIQQPLFLVEKVIPQLEEVSYSINDIAMISDGQFAPNFLFYLKVLWITDYENESTVFPFRFLQRFCNLEMLHVFECDLKELSPYEGDVGKEKDLWTLPKIKKLQLDLLPKIGHLWKQDSTLDHICASLETLEVWRCESLINLGSSSASFQTLTTLDVWNCKGMGELITSSKAQRLVRLVTMRIRQCEMMKEVVGGEGDGDSTDEIIFGELKCLELHCLPSLRNFCSGNHTFKFPSLEQVILSQCPGLKSFCHGALSTLKLQRVQVDEMDYKGRWAGDLNATIKQLHKEKVGFRGLKLLKLSMFPQLMDIWNRNPQEFVEFRNLTALIIKGCGNLKHVLSYSMAQCLQQLESFEIIKCSGIQEIMAMEEINDDGKRATISFPHLNSLKIKGLQKLVGFCHENYSLEFPSLKILKIKQCPKLKGFINKSMRKDITTGTTNEALFNEQVTFPNLEKMVISHLRNVKRIWFDRFHSDSFCMLKELKAEYCDQLLNIFPSFVLRVFQGLEILTVTDCRSLKEVFKVQVPRLDIKDTCVVTIPLRELYLYRLPNLKHVWNMDPHGNISFQNLRKVDVLECWSLKSLFPFSIAKDLAQLESLEVQSCWVEEIVSKNEGLDQEIWLEFPRLSSLELWILPNLKCFYPGKHNTTWPALRKLKTHACWKLKIFGQLKSQIQQPLFLVEKVIPQLEEVSFSIDDIAMLSNGRFAPNFLFYLKVLWITGLENESTVFPFRFLQRFCNLEMLHVFDCNFKKLSPYEGDVGKEKDLRTLPKLKKLRLDLLPKIGHLWKPDSSLDHICASLETLEVWRCETLINLGSYSASFQTLTTLDVWNCKGMGELITSSKAQSLVRLVTMRIRECEMMKEVVAGEGDSDSTDEIIFKELKCLELHCLPSLRNFCSGNHTFKFPSLEQVILNQCPGLKSFCHGALSTPKLQRVQLDEMDYKGSWTGDLNATVQQLYKEQNVQISEDKIEDTI